MQNSKQNFLHPKLPSKHKLAEHVLFKVTKSQFDEIKFNKCPKCDTPFVCDIENKQDSCWCFRFPVQSIDKRLSNCLCQSCLNPDQ
jgi:hypothetical protein